MVVEKTQSEVPRLLRGVPLLILIPTTVGMLSVVFGWRPFEASEAALRWIVSLGFLGAFGFGAWMDYRHVGHWQQADLPKKVGTATALSAVIFSRWFGLGYLVPGWLGNYEMLLMFAGASLLCFKPGQRLVPFCAALCAGTGMLGTPAERSGWQNLLGGIGVFTLLGYAIVTASLDARAETCPAPVQESKPTPR